MEKRKAILPVVLGVTTLLIAVLGATYAYFSVNTTNTSGTTVVTGNADNVGSVTMTTPVNAVHLNIKAADMSGENQGNDYFATNDSELDYVQATDTYGTDQNIQNIIANTHTIAKATLLNDTSNTTYKCTFNLNPTVTGNMAGVYDSGSNWDGVMIIYNKTNFLSALGSGNMTGAFSNIYYMGAPVDGTLPMTIYLNGANASEIEIGLSFYVRNDSSDQNHLAGTTLNMTITNSNLNCTLVNPNEVNTSAPGTILEGESNLSSKLLGGLYRYQGETANNYICFGTTDRDECTGNTSNYMYRILGITSDNKLKLIKDQSIGDMKWNANSTTNITWPNSDLYTAINGSSYLENTTYIPDSTWSDKIASTTWKYGDIRGASLNGDILYSLENAWVDTTTAKIGLMYQHDFVYGNTWIPSTNSPWMISRYGLYSRDGHYIAWYANSVGDADWRYVHISNAVLPVFYLNSMVESDLSGTGSINDPFIIVS